MIARTNTSLLCAAVGIYVSLLWVWPDAMESGFAGREPSLLQFRNISIKSL